MSGATLIDIIISVCQGTTGALRFQYAGSLSGTTLTISVADGRIPCQSLIQSGIRPSLASEIGPRTQVAWQNCTIGPSHLLGHLHSASMHCMRHIRAKIASHSQA